MQIQKHLFRLSEKLLSTNATAVFLRYLFTITLFFFILSSVVFGFAITHLKKGTTRLSECIASDNTLNSTLLQPDIAIFIKIDQEKDMKYPNISSYFGMGTGCRIYMNAPPQFSEDSVAFSQTYLLLSLSNEARTKYEFNNYTIYLSREYFPWYHIFYSDFDLIVNELLEAEAFMFSKLVARTKSGQSLGYQRTDHEPGKIYSFCAGFIGLVLLQTMSLIYIYTTIVSAPSLLMVGIDLLRIRTTITPYYIYKVFPWMGIYMFPLDRSRNLSKMAGSIAVALLCFFSFIYCTYFGSMQFITNFMMLQPVRGVVSENYFGFIAIMEFMCLVLLRTRTSLKFYPVVYLPVQLSFITYCGVVLNGYKGWLLLANVSATLCVLSVLLLKIEVPAATTWNKGMNYTPSESRPRIMYFPSFSLLWMNDTPDLWSIMVPLVGRGFFRQEELSLVDENFEMLRGNMRANQLH